jgi:hypothetical protein
MFGCENDDNGDDAFTGVDRSDVAGQSFVFPNASAFGIPGQQLTLAVGAFGAGGEEDLAPFTITTTTPAGTATGLIDVDPEGGPFDERAWRCWG